MNRARIMEISEEAANKVFAGLANDQDIGAIESAILRFAEELLTAEPSEKMIELGYKAYVEANRKHKPAFTATFRAMSAQLLKEIKNL